MKKLKIAIKSASEPTLDDGDAPASRLQQLLHDKENRRQAQDSQEQARQGQNSQTTELTNLSNSHRGDLDAVPKVGIIGDESRECGPIDNNYNAEVEVEKKLQKQDAPVSLRRPGQNEQR